MNQLKLSDHKTPKLNSFKQGEDDLSLCSVCGNHNCNDDESCNGFECSCKICTCQDKEK